MRAERRAAALDQSCRRPCGEVLHQRERRGVAHRDPVDVGDRQREPRALKQRAEIAQVGERRDARRHAAFDLGLGLGKRRAQLGRDVAADHRRQQQAVRFEGAANLNQRARQIVDELKRQRGDDEIEGGVAERQCFLVRRHRQRPPVIPPRPDRLPRCADPIGKRAPHRVAWRAEIDRQIESPQTADKPPDEIVGGTVDQKRRGSSAPARARRARNSGRSKITGCGIPLL